MEFKGIRTHLSPTAFGLAIASLVVILYVKSKSVFDSGNLAATLVLVSLVSAIVALLLALLSLPDRLGILSIAVVILLAYLIFFTRLYGLS